MCNIVTYMIFHINELNYVRVLSLTDIAIFRHTQVHPAFFYDSILDVLCFHALNPENSVILSL